MKAFVSFLLLMAVTPTFGGQPQPQETDKILYLADSGIVVLQLSILVDGQGPKAHFEKFVDSLLKDLDKNNDGVVTVEESRGKLLTAREAQQMQLVVIEGTPVDPISRAELLAYFKRIGLSPFSVKFQPRVVEADPNAGAMPNQTGEAPLFDKLDINGDKRLSVDELANALEVLRKLDRDDDETISVAELQPLANQTRAATRQAMNATPPTPNPFISPASAESMPKLIRRLVDKYDSADPAKSGVPSLSAKNQKLSRLELGLGAAEFEKYDVDGDGQLDFTELRPFVTSPEVTFELSLNLTTGKVEAIGESKAQIRSTADGAVHLQFGTAQISISATPSAGTIDPETLIKPLFTALDTDANGYLEKSEASGNVLYGATFSDLDADKNGKVYLDEIVGYMKPRLDAARSRVELSIVEQGRTLFDILDSDRDGRLAHRELRSAADKLALWDKDLDGQLAETEIPLQFQIIAARGAITNLGPVRQNRSMTQRTGDDTRTSGPIWFRKMDRNSDGEISRREFLGDLELFDKLDKNGDGAIELKEALQ